MFCGFIQVATVCKLCLQLDATVEHVTALLLAESTRPEHSPFGIFCFYFKTYIQILGNAVLSLHTVSSPPTHQGKRPSILHKGGYFYQHYL